MVNRGTINYLNWVFGACLLVCAGRPLLAVADEVASDALALKNAEQSEGLAETEKVTPDPEKQIPVTASTFVCLQELHAVRGFFVGNLLGKLEETVAAATQPNGATYPAGSVVQLIPTEVMIKHRKGWNPATRDWEFFELTVSQAGSKINVRGTTEVINKFDGNCFECHQKAAPQWDMICEHDHGCDSLPIPNFVIRMIQDGDPRCE